MLGSAILLFFPALSLMRQDSQDQLAMAGRVAAYLSAHAAQLAPSDVASAQAQLVVTLYEQASTAQGPATRRTKLLTETGKQAKATLLDLLPALLGPLSRTAARTQDHDLLATATLSGKQLRKLRPVALLSVAGAVLDSAARPTTAAELSKQGLPTKALQPLRDALDAFRTAQPAPRQAIDARVQANTTLTTHLGALLDALRELDQDMKAFKLLDRPLYEGYLQARKIVSSGGGSSKDNAAALAAQPKPASPDVAG